MRITNQLNAYKSITTTQSGISAFYDINAKLGNGTKILDSYEGASTYIDNARLEYELKTLEQVEKATNLALEMTKNTDKALGDLVDLISQFKVKVTQAASATQDQTSREAIAKELQVLRDNIVNIANTSINGQYLFSGSLASTKPFDSNGNYHGNSGYMNVVTGSGTQSAYNVPGYDLFFKADKDYSKQISTNVSFKDNRYDLNANPDQERYLETIDKISSLIGLNYVANNSPLALDPKKDFDEQPLDFPSTAFYVQGTRPDGSSFKSAILLQQGDTMQDTLDRIGALYGNTSTSKVVDVSLNASGQIQIKDLKQGNEALDFHAVAFTPQFQNVTELKEAMQAHINAGGTKESFTNDVLAQAIPNGDINNVTSPVNLTIGGQNYSINLHQTSLIHSNMTDNAGNATDGADYDNVFFEKNGNKVLGNVSQIVRNTGEYATDSTKLSEVSGTTALNNTSLSLSITSRSGQTYDATIDLANSRISYNDANGNTISFPFMHTAADGVNAQITQSNDITYRQLNDVITLFATDSMPTATINTPNANDYSTYQNSLEQAKNLVEVTLDYQGKMLINDKFSSSTNIELSLRDSSTSVFPAPPYTNTATTTEGSSFVFSANNSLTIDEPHIDLIKDLDKMIAAVISGDHRANSEAADPRNTGMQGALERLDHLGDHLRKQRTLMGASAKGIEQTNERSTLLKANVTTIKSGVIDVDLAETITQMMQIQTTYQAALKATTMLSQLSLLNYL